MQIGMIGLGRMGANMVRRLMRAGHECVVWDLDRSAVDALAGEGATGVRTVKELAAALETPRAVWLMVPAAVVDAAIRDLAPHLGRGDIIIDGGNSRWGDDIRRAAELRASGIHYLDVGTSGGVWGLERGYCLMIGGEDDAVRRLEPAFTALAPGRAAAPPTPGRDTTRGTADQGWLHCGPNGAGHFVKMVHNGIEYGLMAAYAEGLAILRAADAGMERRTADAETAPMQHPELYRYELDVAEITELWRRGSVIESWLLDLTAGALVEDPHLDAYAGHVSDSGEGRWTIMAAIDESVPAPVLSAALYQRFASRGGSEFANKVLSAMRHQFGGHVEKPAHA